MTEISVQFSTTDAQLQFITKPTMAIRRKTPLITTPPGNLFNHQQGNHKMQYRSVIPTISLSSFSDLKEKLIRMAAANNKSVKQATMRSPTPTEFRLKLPASDMLQTKPRLLSSTNRPVAVNIPKSSLSYPTVIPRSTTAHRTNNNINNSNQQQQGARFLYVLNTPVYSRRTNSARILNSNINTLPLHQQPTLLASPLLPRPHPQYGHFLAYLRRQSLARMRRKQQQEEEGLTDNIETTITLNPTRPSPLLFQSTSNVTLRTIISDTPSSIPTLNFQPKHKTRSLSSYRFFQRSPSFMGANSRLNINPSPSSSLKLPPPAPSSSPRIVIKKPPTDEQSFLTQASVVITPTNSIVDETIISPIKKTPYELQLSGDMLNYCYVSESGVKYQGQLLSTSV